MTARNCVDAGGIEAFPSACTAPGWRGRLVAQFGRPRGPFGRLIGRLMAAKNRARGAWAVDQLELRATSRVLEIGPGPGTELARAAAIASRGFVAGVDHSLEMVTQSKRRLAAPLAAGRAEVRLASASELPYADATFDCVFSINSVQFWDDPSRALAEIQRVLRPGGRVAIAYQPRSGNRTALAARRAGEAIRTACQAAGFRALEIRTLPGSPAPTVCVIGKREAFA